VAWTLRSLGRNISETVLTKEHHELVTSGPYRWVRHPLYTSGVALFLALGLMADSGFILVVTLVAAVLIRTVVVPLEERELVRKFGPAYLDYVGRTGRLLPRVVRGPASRSARRSGEG
jgi:protein-S-isoprenylcysteine O-methyltransferase